MGAGVIVVLAYLSDIEEWIAQGWYVAAGHGHPVMTAYGRVYVYREE